MKRVRVSILTFDGFNEIDSLVALNILKRIPELDALLVGSQETICSMNGVRITAQAGLSALQASDAVLIGSGIHTRRIVNDGRILSQLSFDPARQLIAAQCSGAMVLAALNLVGDDSVCTDRSTRSDLERLGIRVSNEPFRANGNVATAGGCLSAPYLAGWIIWRMLGLPAVREALRHVMPVGQEEAYLDNVVQVVGPYIPSAESASPLP